MLYITQWNLYPFLKGLWGGGKRCGKMNVKWKRKQNKTWKNENCTFFMWAYRNYKQIKGYVNTFVHCLWSKKNTACGDHNHPQPCVFDMSWMILNLDFWKNLFEIWTNQEDLKESFSYRNEETLVKLTKRTQCVSIRLSHLPYMEDCSLTDLLCYLIFCKGFGI